MNALLVLLGFGTEALKKVPNFDQKKRQEFERLTDKYRELVNSNEPDDDLLLNVRDKIISMAKIFEKELKGL